MMIDRANNLGTMGNQISGNATGYINYTNQNTAMNTFGGGNDSNQPS